MPRKRHTPEEIIHKLRDAELALAKGAPNGDAGHQFGVTEQTYYRWRKEYGGMQVDQAKRLKDLERENARLKRLLAAGGKRRSVGRIAGECPLAIQFGGAAHPSPSAALVQRAPDPWRRCILGIPEQRRRRSNRRRRRGSGPCTAFSGGTGVSSANCSSVSVGRNGRVGAAQGPAQRYREGQVGLVGCWAVAVSFAGAALLLTAPVLVPVLLVTALAFLVFRRGGFPRHIDII